MLSSKRWALPRACQGNGGAIQNVYLANRPHSRPSIPPDLQSSRLAKLYTVPQKLPRIDLILSNMGVDKWTADQDDSVFRLRTEFDKLTWKEFAKIYKDRSRGPARTPQSLCKRFKRVTEKNHQRAERGRNVTSHNISSDRGPYRTVESEWSVLRERLLPNPAAESSCTIGNGGPEHVIANAHGFRTNRHRPHDIWWTDCARPVSFDHRVQKHHPSNFCRLYHTFPISAFRRNAEIHPGRNLPLKMISRSNPDTTPFSPWNSCTSLGISTPPMLPSVCGATVPDSAFRIAMNASTPAVIAPGRLARQSGGTKCGI